jgi:hypothetical protein
MVFNITDKKWENTNYSLRPKLDVAAFLKFSPDSDESKHVLVLGSFIFVKSYDI